MKNAIVCLIGLVFVVSASAEPLLEGQVRLDSGEPVADAQVRLFDLSDLRQGAIARAMTDGRGYFALPLSALTGRALPERFALGPNYPNPFNPSTIIPYQLAASSQVRLEVFNLLGQHIATLVDGERPAGFHTATWHATDGVGRAVGAGVYIYRMTVGVESQTGRMVLIDGQAGLATGGATSFWSGVSGVGGSDGGGAQAYGLIVSGSGLVPYVDSAFRIESGMAPVELVVSAGQHSAGKATDDDCALCGLLGAFNDQQEEEETDAEEEAAETDSTSIEGGPDLIVQSPSVNDSILTPGQAFTLQVTVQNQGDEQAAATMLHYYRSNNSTISASDTEVGTDAIDALDASATSEQSIELTASVGVETYYGACVASVSGESNTDNNCSSAVRITVGGQATAVYWTDTGTNKIQWANLDGSQVKDLVTTGLVTLTGLALDMAGSKIYWTDAGTDKIQRANLDGSGVEDLVTTGLDVPAGLALDVAGSKIYWTDWGTAKIQRANLDGSQVEDLVTTGLDVPGDIALDVADGKIYWTDWGTAKIQRANLDGSQVEDLVTTGLEAPDGIALDVADGKIYWTDLGTDKIQRANLDGSGVEDLVTTGLDEPYDLALDVADGKIYWTDAGTDKIQRANLDGSGVEDLVTTGLVTPFRIALGYVPVEQGSEPDDQDNEGSSDGDDDDGDGGDDDGDDGDGGSDGDVISLSITNCSGSYLFSNSGAAFVGISGTVYVHRSVSSVRLTGYANGEWVGVDFISGLSAGESETFGMGGIITTSGSSLNCSVAWEATFFTSAKVTAGNAESSEQVREQGSLSTESVLINRKRPLEQP